MISPSLHILSVIGILSVAALLALSATVLDGALSHRLAQADLNGSSCDSEDVGTVDTASLVVSGEFEESCWSEGYMGFVPVDSYWRKAFFNTLDGTLSVEVTQPTRGVHLQLESSDGERFAGDDRIEAEVGSGRHHLTVSLPTSGNAAPIAFDVTLRMIPDEPIPPTPTHPTSVPPPTAAPSPLPTPNPTATPTPGDSRHVEATPTPQIDETAPVHTCLVTAVIESIADREFERTHLMSADERFYCYSLELPVGHELQITVGSDDTLVWVESVGPDFIGQLVTVLDQSESTTVSTPGRYHIGVTPRIPAREPWTFVVEFRSWTIGGDQVASPVPTPTEPPPSTPEPTPTIEVTSDSGDDAVGWCQEEDLGMVAGRSFEKSGFLTDDTANPPCYESAYHFTLETGFDLVITSKSTQLHLSTWHYSSEAATFNWLEPNESMTVQAPGYYGLSVSADRVVPDRVRYTLGFESRRTGDGTGAETSTPTPTPTEPPTPTPTPVRVESPTPTASPEPREHISVTFRSTSRHRKECTHPFSSPDLSERARNGLHTIKVSATLDDDECRDGKYFPFDVSGDGLVMQVEVLSPIDAEIINLEHPDGSVRFCPSSRFDIQVTLTVPGAYKLRVREFDDPDADFELRFRLLPITDASAEMQIERCREGDTDPTPTPTLRRPGIQTFVFEFCEAAGLTDGCEEDGVREWKRKYGGGEESTPTVETPPTVEVEPPTPVPIEIESVVHPPRTEEPWVPHTSHWTESTFNFISDPNTLAQVVSFVNGALCGQICEEYDFVPVSPAFEAGWFLIGIVPAVDVIPDARDALLEAYQCFIWRDKVTQEYGCNHIDLGINWVSIVPFGGIPFDILAVLRRWERSIEGGLRSARGAGRDIGKLLKISLRPVGESGERLPGAFEAQRLFLRTWLVPKLEKGYRGLATDVLDGLSDTTAISKYATVPGMLPDVGRSVEGSSTVVGRFLNSDDVRSYTEFKRVTYVLDERVTASTVWQLNREVALPSDGSWADLARRLGVTGKSEIDVIGSDYYMEIHGVTESGIRSADKSKFMNQLLLAAHNGKREMRFVLFGADDDDIRDLVKKQLRQMVGEINRARPGTIGKNGLKTKVEFEFDPR